MTRTALFFAACLAACSEGGSPPEAEVSGIPSWDVVVSESGPWQATLSRNGADTDSYVFPRSRGDYRRAGFVGDVPITRTGAFDTITFPEGVEALTFSVTPYTQPIPETYTPVLDFGGDTAAGYAVFSGLFGLATLPDDVTPDQMADPRYSGMTSIGVPLTLQGEGAAVWQGEAVALPLTLDTVDDGYAYVGPAEILESESFAGVLDPTLPDWLTDTLEPELREAEEALTRRYGASPNEKPNLFLAFDGFDAQGLSLTGGALPGPTLALQVGGSAMADPNPDVAAYLRWFLLHEVAHTFQTAIGFRPNESGADWVVEGSANSAAHIVAQELDGGDILERRTEQAVAACASVVEGRRLEDTLTDGSGTYECGDLVMRAAAKAAGVDVFALQKGLAGDREAGWAGVRATSLALGATDEALSALDALFTGTVTDARAALEALEL